MSANIKSDKADQEEQKKPNRIWRVYYWLAERLYHELAWTYDLVSWLVSLGHWSTWRRVALDYVAGKRVLELGFGTGELLKELAKNQLFCIGLDPSSEMQLVTRRKSFSQRIRLNQVQGKSQQIPFADGSFDVVLSTFPAGYILDPETWNEVGRVLRQPDPSTGAPGGIFIVVGMVILLTDEPSSPVDRADSRNPASRVLKRCQRLALEAGLDLRLVMRKQGIVYLPILLASRR